MARHTDTEPETDSLGISGDSDGQVLNGRWQQQPDGDKDLQEYARSLGVSDLRATTNTDVDLIWLVREAFEAPLPASWSEHIDVEGRVYFFNETTEESIWSHPMDGVYRELVAVIEQVRVQEPAHHVEQRAEMVRQHLLEVHARALASLDGWSGPYAGETGQYFFNERLGLSTWVSPIDGWEHELAIRHSVLHRALLVGAPGTQEQYEPAYGADLLGTPVLHLPLGLMRPEDEVQSSSRSFYTARESSRSGQSARSLGEGVSPGRAKRPAAPPPPPESESEAGEVTFGRTNPIQMPVLEKA